MLPDVRVQVFALHVDHAVQDDGALSLGQHTLHVELTPCLATLSLHAKVFHVFRRAFILAVFIHGKGFEELIEFHSVVLEELLEKSSLFKGERSLRALRCLRHEDL